MPRFVHIVLLCWLGFVLTGLPRLCAEDACASACLEQGLSGDDDCGGGASAAPCDASCSACVCAGPPVSLLPSPVSLPEVPRLMLTIPPGQGGAESSGPPGEVFQPPREA
ncbi:hypothetical protein [Archangium lipolyticum]|uniref:hypothetical protein n=1 Tax=Archangium lipolyticum TaxID=2970465 RepID=UPI00214A604F|nr:hypothetical protein [Archangium lipolyticum]